MAQEYGGMFHEAGGYLQTVGAPLIGLDVR